MASAKKTKTTEQSYIYCGPNLPKGLLTQHTIYRGELPAHLTKYFEGCPGLRRLFVPVDLLGETTVRINKTGTPESIWYKEVIEHFSGGGN